MPDDAASNAAWVSAIASVFSAVASIVTAIAVRLQYLMWQEAKRQNDFQAKPSLRLKEHRVSDVKKEEASSFVPRSITVATLTEAYAPRPYTTLKGYYAVDAEEEWLQHLQGKGNFASIPNVELGFIVENISQAMALGFTLNVVLTVSGNPSDPMVKPKDYVKNYDVVFDVTTRTPLFIPLIHCRYLFGVKIDARITSIRGISGVEVISDSRKQPSQSLEFRNAPLIKVVTPALSAGPAPDPS